jgi:hypothetical protein
MNVVYVLQSGTRGPIAFGCCAERALRRRLTALQQGNPELLYLRLLLDGDERLLRSLRERFAPARLRGDWYAADVLGRIPASAPRLALDDSAEARRLAAMTLAELAPRR